VGGLKHPAIYLFLGLLTVLAGIIFRHRENGEPTDGSSGGDLLQAQVVRH